MYYSISLRCSGGDPGGALLASAFGLPIKYERRVGDPLIGAPGMVKKNFVSFSLPEVVREGMEFEDGLSYLLDQIEAGGAVFAETKATGASFDLYAILYEASSLGVNLDVDTMERLVRLGLKLNIGID